MEKLPLCADFGLCYDECQHVHLDHRVECALVERTIRKLQARTERHREPKGERPGGGRGKGGVMR